MLGGVGCRFQVCCLQYCGKAFSDLPRWVEATRSRTEPQPQSPVRSSRNGACTEPVGRTSVSSSMRPRSQHRWSHRHIEM